MGRRTFEADVYFLSQPRVDPIGGRVFGNGVLFNPPATGERVEVVAGVNGPIDLTENGPGWKEATLKHSEWRDAMAAAAAVCGGCSPASMHSGLRQNSSWLDFWETEAEQKGEELVECKVLCI